MDLCEICLIAATLTNIIKLAILENVHLGFFYLAANELITDKIQDIFTLIAEYSSFIKYT